MLVLLAFAVLAAACAREGTLPKESEIRGRYGKEAAVRLSGNVVEVTVEQPEEHLARGGSLWAQVGPYIYLFSRPTQDILNRYNGVAAVRVITRTPGGEEIARATLVRDTLSDILWREALYRAGRARLEGSTHPQRLDDLVRWGERYADYRYSYR